MFAESTDPRDRDDSTDAALKKLPIDSTDPKDPALKADPHDPTLPIESTDPSEAMDNRLS